MEFMEKIFRSICREFNLEICNQFRDKILRDQLQRINSDICRDVLHYFKVPFKLRPFLYFSSSDAPSNLISSCNINCTCSDIPFEPICSVHNVQYYSPCHAGCTDYITNEHTKVQI